MCVYDEHQELVGIHNDSASKSWLNTIPCKEYLHYPVNATYNRFIYMIYGIKTHCLFSLCTFHYNVPNLTCVS